MIVACMKWVASPDAAPDDERFAGVSEADQAALEVALRLGANAGEPVVAVTVGASGAERALRDALACGATHARRVDAHEELASDSVAAEIAQIAHDASFVVCGDHSSDRGSGSVPAFLAHRLGAAQALGGVSVEPLDGSVRVVRRLDGGRREVLRVGAPAVISVEGSVASLRRASLRAVLAARTAAIDVSPRHTAGEAPAPVLVTPYRPRARVLPPPRGDDALARVRALTDTGGTGGHGETVTLPPAEAADRILAALRDWGYL